MRCAPVMVDSLCAMTRHVLPSISLSMAAWTSRSLSVSRELVASSSMRMGAFLMMALAMQMRWR